MKLLYFAWVRERIGEGSETYSGSAKTVGELVSELRAQGERYNLAFSDLASLRVAVDQELVDWDASIESAAEVAFFPPMTGG